MVGFLKYGHIYLLYYQYCDNLLHQTLISIFDWVVSILIKSATIAKILCQGS